MKRCKWCNLNNPLYIEYHDNEWGVLKTDDHYLFEMLILESFQAGLSWECILNKRKAFREAYDNFDIDKICNYNEDKINELINNKKIVRNKLKIKSSINNAIIFRDVVKDYIKTFTGGKIFYEWDRTTNDVSDKMSADLIKRGMKFVGSTIIYSYLQAVGVIYSHMEDCFMFKSR